MASALKASPYNSYLMRIRLNLCYLLSLLVVFCLNLSAQSVNPCNTFVDSTECLLDTDDTFTEVYDRAVRWSSYGVRRHNAVAAAADRFRRSVGQSKFSVHLDSVYAYGLQILQQSYTPEELCQLARFWPLRSQFRNSNKNSSRVSIYFSIAEQAHCYDFYSYTQQLMVQANLNKDGVTQLSHQWHPRAPLFDTAAQLVRNAMARRVKVAFESTQPHLTRQYAGGTSGNYLCMTCTEAPNIAGFGSNTAYVSMRTDSTAGILGLLSRLGEPNTIVAELCLARTTTTATDPFVNEYFYEVYNVLAGSLPDTVEYLVHRVTSDYPRDYSNYTPCELRAFALAAPTDMDYPGTRQLDEGASPTRIQLLSAPYSMLSAYFAPLLRNGGSVSGVDRLRSTNELTAKLRFRLHDKQGGRASVSLDFQTDDPHAALLSATALLTYDTATFGTQAVADGFVTTGSTEHSRPSYYLGPDTFYQVSLQDREPGVLAWQLDVINPDVAQSLDHFGNRFPYPATIEFSLAHLSSGDYFQAELKALKVDRLSLSNNGLSRDTLDVNILTNQVRTRITSRTVKSSLTEILGGLHEPGNRLTAVGSGLGYSQPSQVWLPCRFPDSTNVPLYGYCNVQPWHATGTGFDFESYEGDTLRWKVPETYSYGLDGRKGLIPQAGEVRIGRYRPSGVHVTLPAATRERNTELRE